MYLHNPPDPASIAEATANAYVNRSKRRVRTKFNKYQLDILEATFQKTHYPDVSIVDRLADVLTLGTERISVWFQNRRARFKRSKKNQRGFDEDSFESNESIQFQTLPQTIFDLKLNQDADSVTNVRQSLNSLENGHGDSNDENNSGDSPGSNTADYDYERQIAQQTNSFETSKKDNSDEDAENKDDYDNDDSSHNEDQVVSKPDSYTAENTNRLTLPIIPKVSSNYNISSLHNFVDDQTLNYYPLQNAYTHQFGSNSGMPGMLNLPIPTTNYPYHTTSTLQQQQHQPFYGSGFMPQSVQTSYSDNTYTTLYNQPQATHTFFSPHSLFQPYNVDDDTSNTNNYYASAITSLLPIKHELSASQYSDS
jgi:hypothetical protein